MNRKQRVAKAKALGISYQQLLQQNRGAQKAPPSPEEAQLTYIQSYASDLDLIYESHGESFFLAGHGVAITLPNTLDGRKQATAWLEEYEKQNYVPEV